MCWLKADINPLWVRATSASTGAFATSKAARAASNMA
jgi:hypothetical protein